MQNWFTCPAFLMDIMYTQHYMQCCRIYRTPSFHIHTYSCSQYYILFFSEIYLLKCDSRTDRVHMVLLLQYHAGCCGAPINAQSTANTTRSTILRILLWWYSSSAAMRVFCSHPRTETWVRAEFGEPTLANISTYWRQNSNRLIIDKRMYILQYMVHIWASHLAKLKTL